MLSEIIVTDKLKMIREARKISKRALAFYLNKSEEIITNLENGATAFISLYEFLLICDLFKVTPKQFFNIEEEGIPPNYSPMQIRKSFYDELVKLNTREQNMLEQLAKNINRQANRKKNFTRK